MWQIPIFGNDPNHEHWIQEEILEQNELEKCLPPIEPEYFFFQ
jgi:hypothetical protein